MAVAPPKGLNGKTVLVTGASGAIGQAIARAAANEGANVIAHCSRPGTVDSLCRELEGLGVSAFAIDADFGKPDAAETLFAAALERCGCIDLLVNSASVFPGDTLQSVTLPDFNGSMLVNAWAPLVLGRALSRLTGSCAEGDKAIVNLLDTRIVGGDTVHASYILSKHLLAALTGMMAREFAPAIRVNAVAPGLMASANAGDVGTSAAAAKNLPLRRAAHPCEVADAVMYLLESRSVTGQVLYVDGGRHLRGSPPNLATMP
jgi:NAD(P)-dependent dehydrogenase (short-subunit alcohol dehydrogenase family)